MAIRRLRKTLTYHLHQISAKFYIKMLTAITVSMFGTIYYISLEETDYYPIINRKTENLLRKQLKYDKNSGCVMPYLDPFSNESTWSDRVPDPIICTGTNWVKCYHSKCRIINKILHYYTNISCTYRDIVFQTDFLYYLGRPIQVIGANVYQLNRSDHVNVTCTGSNEKGLVTWSGNLAGFRPVSPIASPQGRQNTINILIFAFDSTARIRFIRHMPKSYKYITQDLQATILTSYNIAGDGTKEVLTMMLTGKALYELPSVQPRMKRKLTCDAFPFIFYRLKEDGYRTAFLEDGPDLGTYQWDANGFQQQPTDHYQSAYNTHNRQFSFYNHGCLGDTPQYEVIMDLNVQFMRLDGKKFIFTLVGDISHNDSNLITNADEAFVTFLTRFREEGHETNTLLIVMGDHGPRFGVDRRTAQSQLEERLPLMAIVLPEQLKEERPDVLPALKKNANYLTTPYDIHSTLLDAVGLRKYWNNYTVPGADHPRGRTLLEPIPANRTCSEAGITPHYCACLLWHNVSKSNRLYKMAGEAFVGYVNHLLQPVKSLCKPRTLAEIGWVKKLHLYTSLANPQEIYQVKVTLDPGASTFESTLTYVVKEDIFEVNSKDISRTNRPISKDPR
ncbi:uncharacterized protein LOC128676447 isoform X2 [Plodia interpunctella]|uniref:uncharacterized protein LOC128676447 isoform X2 n=1 Tax=Plodia interpunctella TaxID=58824 RepID=UPI0023686094|nr:uncharacterized protein LOC128676447 isoform X2 [Plodia interpunctella]